MGTRSVDTFRTNVQRASRMLFEQSVADRPRQTRELIEQRLREIEKQHPRYPLWLSPQSLDDFDRESFAFLPPDELDELAAKVEDVRDVARGIPEGSPAHPDQLDRARSPFVRVVELMGFDRYDDVKPFVIGKTIERRLAPVWPPHLDHLRFRTGFDSTGDPALWVWGYVSQTGEYDSTPFLEWASDIRRVLDPICHEFAPENRAFLRFRSTAEPVESEGVAA